ncbi:hypothetical protein [Ruixingdingia sedimenti]|uniref:Uncharacterized protein n=1 Tax=Ruixingdingia sedimenti TaxID=3073604 RepID=A0ABU1FFD6_9RHOB|nr:hypothetical protein [Xinfangfangia sp. LG-4]MDR5655298.1 hypothetical protein [Xinfangfangia sp. LG-4]
MNRIERTEEAVAQYGDIAYQGNGRWLCHDTGIEYSNADIGAMLKPALVKAPAKPLSQKALNARNAAKNHGMKALKGSAAQKEWAEKIRAEKISFAFSSYFPEAERPEALEALARLTKAKFWIENRTKSSDAIFKLAVASLRAERKVEEIEEALNLFIMLEEQKLGNFGMGFNTGRWPAEARKRFDELRDEMSKAGRDII